MCSVHKKINTPCENGAGTLREWRLRFFENIDKVHALQFIETFIGMWAYYLCCCEGGFAERYIGDVQMLLIKPLCRRASLLPPLTEQISG
jgi:cyclopropane-fatty-acyl-phospholipid synthase